MESLIFFFYLKVLKIIGRSDYKGLDCWGSTAFPSNSMLCWMEIPDFRNNSTLIENVKPTICANTCWVVATVVQLSRDKIAWNENLAL